MTPFHFSMTCEGHAFYTAIDYLSLSCLQCIPYRFFLLDFFFFFFLPDVLSLAIFQGLSLFTRNSYTYAMDKCSSHLLFLLCTQASLIFFANKSFQFRNKHRLLCCPKPRTPDVIIFPKFGLRQINCQDSINSLQRYPHSPVS